MYEGNPHGAAPALSGPAPEEQTRAASNSEYLARGPSRMPPAPARVLCRRDAVYRDSNAEACRRLMVRARTAQGFCKAPHLLSPGSLRSLALDGGPALIGGLT